MKQEQGKMIDGDKLIERIREQIGKIMLPNARKGDLFGTVSNRTIDALTVVIQMIEQMQKEG